MITDFHEIFAALKKELKKYTKHLTTKIDDDSHFDLWSIKDVVTGGRKYKKVYFAGLVI